MAIGWSMESGRRGYGASSGWKIFKVFWLDWELRGCSLIGCWVKRILTPIGCPVGWDLENGEVQVQWGKQEKNNDKNIKRKLIVEKWHNPILDLRKLELDA
ncbi:UNVERIFIED_CONTAM: hypothetical protein NCL1_48638 [Trichonephila clavipes]